MFATSLTRRAFSISNARAAINEVVVVGGGLMGTGIAQVAAQANQKVALVDLNEKVLGKAEKRIKDSVARVAKKMFKDNPEAGQEFTTNTLERVTFTQGSEEVMSSADLVVEAVTENLALKQRLFSEWDKACPEKTILATNTSFLKVTDVMKDVARQDRCGGLHFFNPVPVMKLLEVVRIDSTSDDTFQSMFSWGQAIGKYCVTCKDTPGFIVNRLLGPYMADAIAMVERGDATYQDVDAAVKLGLGYPMGPFELLDYTGIDLHKYINDNQDLPFRAPSKLIDQLVSEGKLGMKTGEGFYKYKK